MKSVLLAIALMGSTTTVLAAGSDNPVVNLCGAPVQFKNISQAVNGASVGQLVRDLRQLDQVDRVLVCYKNGLVYVIAENSKGVSYSLSIVEK